MLMKYMNRAEYWKRQYNTGRWYRHIDDRNDQIVFVKVDWKHKDSQRVYYAYAI